MKSILWLCNGINVICSTFCVSLQVCQFFKLLLICPQRFVLIFLVKYKSWQWLGSMIGFYVLLINKAERTLALTPGNQFMDTLFVSVFPMVFVHCTAVVTKLDSDINTTSCSSYLPLVCWTGKTSWAFYCMNRTDSVQWSIITHYSLVSQLRPLNIRPVCYKDHLFVIPMFMLTKEGSI